MRFIFPRNKHPIYEQFYYQIEEYLRFAMIYLVQFRTNLFLLGHHVSHFSHRLHSATPFFPNVEEENLISGNYRSFLLFSFQLVFLPLYVKLVIDFSPVAVVY